MSEKRYDLQGLRGLAIAYVLLFHWRPSEYRLGFVGVDMFFVLSGYLMSLILMRKPITGKAIGMFYKRRFRRILPIYILVVFFTYIGAYFLVLGSDRDQIAKDILWSMELISNMQPIYEEKGYWDQISSYRFFTHTWSLSVEIQYYFIAPFLMKLLSCFSFKNKVFVLLFLIICSLGLQISSHEKIAYGFLLCRIWQFLFGSMAYEWSHQYPNTERHCLKDQETSQSAGISARHSCSRLLLILLSVLVVCSPARCPDAIARMFGCLTAMMIVASGTTAKDSLARWNPLEYGPLVRLGDISYVVYLIHWPLFTCSKYLLDVPKMGLYFGVITILATIAISSIFSDTIEKYFLKVSLQVALIWFVIIISILAATLPYYTAQDGLESTQVSNDTIQDAIRFNDRESRKVYMGLPCHQDIEIENITMLRNPNMRCIATAKGKANIVVLGNSIAYRAFPLIHKILRGRYNTLRLFTLSTSLPLYRPSFPEFTDAMKRMLDIVKPDIVLHSHSTSAEEQLAKFTDVEQDEVFKEWQSNLDYLCSKSKHVIIDVPYYIMVNRPVGREIAHRLAMGKFNLTDFVITKEQDDAFLGEHRKRLSHLTCKDNKLQFHETNKLLYDADGKLYMYNTTTFKTFNGDGVHLTGFGLQKFEKTYTEKLHKLIDEIEKN